MSPKSVKLIADTVVCVIGMGIFYGWMLLL